MIFVKVFFIYIIKSRVIGDIMHTVKNNLFMSASWQIQSRWRKQILQKNMLNTIL